MSAGNLKIFDDDEEEDQEPQPSEFSKEYNGKPAVIVNHFFQKQLKTMASGGAVVTKQPESGRPSSLTIKCSAKHAAKVKVTFDTMEKSLREDFDQEDFPIPSNETAKFAGFIRHFFERNDGPDKSRVLYMPDIARKRIIVITRSSEGLSQDEKFKELWCLNGSSSTRRDESPVRTGRNADSGATASGARNEDDEKENTYEEMDTLPPPEDLFSRQLHGGFVLKVYKASILRLHVDTIVNAANDTMSHGGGVAYVISQGAGRKLDEESKRHVDMNGKVPVTDNIVSTAGKLNYKGVIHAVGPMWHYYGDKVNCLDDLYKCLINIFKRCDEKKYRSVGIPAISAGIFGVPKELCADTYIRAAVDYSHRKSGNCKYLTEFHFIDVDVRILDLVKESYNRWKRDPTLLDQHKTVPAYLDKHPHMKRGKYGNQQFEKGKGFVGGGRGGTGGQWGENNRGRGQQPDSNRGKGQPLHGNSVWYTPEKTSVKRLPDEKFRWGGKCKKYQIGHMTIKIFSADVTKSSNMDAIVCGMQEGESPESSSGFIAKCLRDKGGSKYLSKLKNMLKNKKPLKVLDVVDCNGGDLKVDFVVHAVMKKVVDAREEEVREYRQMVIKILDHCKSQGMKRVVLPMIGTGTIQTNTGKLEKCAEAMIKGCGQFVNRGDPTSLPNELHLVNKNEEVTSLLCQVFDKVASGVLPSRSPSPKPHSASAKPSGRDQSNHGQSGFKEGQKVGKQNSDVFDPNKTITGGDRSESSGNRQIKKSYSKEGEVTGKDSFDNRSPRGEVNRPKMPLPAPKPELENDYDTVGNVDPGKKSDIDDNYDSVNEDDDNKPAGSELGRENMGAGSPQKMATQVGNLNILEDE